MNNIYKIIILHIAFFVIFLALSLFLWGAGHGSSVPLVVFFAPFLICFYTESYNEAYNALLLLQMPIYTLICYLFQINYLNKKYKLIIPIIHIIFAFIAVFILSVHISERYYYFFILSLMIMLPYWKMFLSIVKIDDIKVN